MFRLLPAGEAAIRVDFGQRLAPALNDRVLRLCESLAGAPPRGFREAVPGFASALVQFDPLVADPEEIREELAVLARAVRHGPSRRGRELEVPAAYGGELGPDLELVASRSRLAREHVVALHAGRRYRVYMLGFVAGFPYMAAVPARIAIARRAEPRPRVPAGAVGIAGRQTGIYPRDAPGGWQLVARTPLRLWNPGRLPPAAILPGDCVRFLPISEEVFASLAGVEPTWAGRLSCDVSSSGCLPREEAFTVVAGGLLTTVQDAGRPGYGVWGVPAGGAADGLSLRVANRLAGNGGRQASLEITAGGLELVARARFRVGLAGADLGARVNGRPFRPGGSRDIAPGDRLVFEGPRRGFRAYLAVHGGLAVPPVLGSAATYLAAGMGGLEGRPLQANDVLLRHAPGAALSAPGDLPWELDPCPVAFPVTLRLVRGPQAQSLSAEGWQVLLGQTWRVGASSDRMAIRLEGEPLPVRGGGELLSAGVAPGTLQVLPSGAVVLLMVDHQTTGGYPQPAVLAGVDMATAAQLSPGAAVRFDLVEAAQARRALAERELTLARWAGRARELGLVVDGVAYRVGLEER